MISIGIDQSYTRTGYCVLSDVMDFGVITTDKNDDAYKRAGFVARQLVDIIKKYPESEITLEGLAFGIQGNATRDLAGLQFIIIDNIREKIGKDVRIVSPTSLKKFATGSGKSKKAEMYYALPEDIKVLFHQKYKISTGLHDITDAYFLAKYQKQD